MIPFILVLIASWICLFLFEEIKVRAKKNGQSGKNPFFIIGTLLLIINWAWVLIQSFNKNEIFGMSVKARTIFFGILTVLYIGLYFYTSFLSLPKGSLDSNENGAVVSSGIYAYCRHPGLYAFWLVAISASFLASSREALIIGIANAVINTIYIIIQDIYFFPHYIEGYEEYKKQVPFLGFSVR